MDVAITAVFALTGIICFTLFALAIVCDLRRITAAEQYYESQRRIAARIEAMPPSFDRDAFFEQVDDYRREVSR
jgi:hypothetical protein